MEDSRVAALTINELQKLLYEVAELEKLGEYSKAFEHLKSIWSDVSELPKVNGFSPLMIAETNLRCGSIFSYLGNSKQIFGAQEKARNLLFAARRKYLELYKISKVAECENMLALTYFHKGEYSEARIWIEQSLSNNLDAIEVRHHSHIVKSLILLKEYKYEEVISSLTAVKNEFVNATYSLKGSFSANLSVAFKNIGKLDEAIKHLTIAQANQKKSKHLPYLAITENNLAQLYRLNSEFDKALNHVETAIKIFEEVGDRARIAFAMDTKANIFIDIGLSDLAVEVTDEAIEMLKLGDNADIISEIYLTKSKALIEAGKISEGVLAVVESINFSKISGNSKEQQIAESFELILGNKHPIVTKKLYSEKLKKTDDLELELPPSILPNQDFFGVWIKNSDFEKIGLTKGSLAIVVKGKVERGDLAAVCDNETDLVTIGFFENQFGLIGLENYNHEPELLDEIRSTIVGKIIGYANASPNENGCYEVKLVTLEKK